MRYWLDTEFMEDGRLIEPLSIGIVREDGAEYYAEYHHDPLRANAWVKENVIPHLRGNPKPIWLIRKELMAFVGVKDTNHKPEFWGYYADYDWIVLCQTFGRMIDLPKGWPMFCRDVKQLCTDLGNPKLPPDPPGEHNALVDARWNRQAWEFLTKMQTEELRSKEGAPLVSVGADSALGKAIQKRRTEMREHERLYKAADERAKKAVALARFAIENRGCDCNEAGHPCGTNQMLDKLEAIEKGVAQSPPTRGGCACDPQRNAVCHQHAKGE